MGYTVILQLRPLQDHCGIHIRDAVSRGLQATGMPQKLQAVGSSPTGVGVREVHSDIAEAAAPRIASVIACASTSASEWPSRPISDWMNAAEDQRPAGRNPVIIPTQTVGYPRQDALRSAVSSDGTGAPVPCRLGG